MDDTMDMLRSIQRQLIGMSIDIDEIRDRLDNLDGCDGKSALDVKDGMTFGERSIDDALITVSVDHSIMKDTLNEILKRVTPPNDEGTTDETGDGGENTVG